MRKSEIDKMALFFQVKGDFFVVAQQNGAEC
jgi:hypothetical protein